MPGLKSTALNDTFVPIAGEPVDVSVSVDGTALGIINGDSDRFASSNFHAHIGQFQIGPSNATAFIETMSNSVFGGDSVLVRITDVSEPLFAGVMIVALSFELFSPPGLITGPHVPEQLPTHFVAAFDVDYRDAKGLGFMSFTSASTFAVTAVPLPATLGLFALGLATLHRWRGVA